MVQISFEDTRRLAIALSRFALRTTIARTAGLLTAPQFQANTIRLELLVHLAAIHCAGKKKPEDADLTRWLYRYLGATEIPRLEDPVEDVFVTNVRTSEGNHRVFEGIWESNDYFVQSALDTLKGAKAPPECRELLKPAYALLRLSDEIAERLGLERWHSEPTQAKGLIRVDRSTRVKERARAVTFTGADLARLGLSRETLSPFIFREEDRKALPEQETGHTSLERRPLVDFSDALVFALPHAASPAIRRFLVSELGRIGYLQAFGNSLAQRQMRRVEDYLLDLKEDTESLDAPEPELQPPPLHAWLLKYDVNKYIHVVLLQDDLVSIDQQGLAAPMRYSEAQRAGLEQYLSTVASQCQSRPGFLYGTSLIVLGGLGRGYMLGFGGWPEGWDLSVIWVSDLGTLADELNNSVKRYLKCMRQKQFVEKLGVNFLNVNGDFNFYCYWRRLNYQIIPRELAVIPDSMIAVAHDFVLPFRQEVRKAADRHSIAAVDGIFLSVARFDRDTYFKSLQDRPLYGSFTHLRAGLLGGAVETSRGATWLVMTPQTADAAVRSLLYQIWAGFFGMLERLVSELERGLANAARGSLEVRLDCRELRLPERYLEPGELAALPPPTVSVNADDRVATIQFPVGFLSHFQRPQNTGERLVLSSIARALLRLHKSDDPEDPAVERVVERVVGDSRVRILHLFETHNPIELLLAQKEERVVFLAHEDFVFAKLKLSEGCTASTPPARLTTEEDCNDFLHNVVDKLWKQLREQLRQLDRKSVLKRALQVYEAVIRDRDHWRRTAQAIIALYRASEDVLAVAQQREKDRNDVSLPARTILEMAICESPVEGGKEVSGWELDELFARAALLIEAATDSDAIVSGLVAPTIDLHPNGEYTIERTFYQAVIQPFLRNWFREEFTEAANQYEDLYRRKQSAERVRADATFAPEFISAFESEYELTPDDAIDGLSELMDLAVEHETVVVVTTVGTVKDRLTRTRGLSARVSAAFFKTFGLFHRPAWDSPPLGYSNKDLNPWRFRRPLSAVVRPVLIFGEADTDTVMYGAGSLRLGFGYLLDRAEKGQFPGGFFRTNAMRKYLGRANDEKGHAFAESVATALRKAGWDARTEVRMSELGAPPKDADGDIDVLAWKTTGEILLLECKRLQLARTVAEIAEICRRFRGEAKDELDRHLKRVRWVIDNPRSLSNVVGFFPDQRRIDARLVTNTHVPMMYLTSLPIPAEKIGPLRELSLEEI